VQGSEQKGKAAESSHHHRRRQTRFHPRPLPTRRPCPAHVASPVWPRRRRPAGCCCCPRQPRFVICHARARPDRRRQQPAHHPRFHQAEKPRRVLGAADILFWHRCSSGPRRPTARGRWARAGRFLKPPAPARELRPAVSFTITTSPQAPCLAPPASAIRPAADRRKRPARVCHAVALTDALISTPILLLTSTLIQAIGTAATIGRRSQRRPIMPPSGRSARRLTSAGRRRGSSKRCGAESGCRLDWRAPARRVWDVPVTAAGCCSRPFHHRRARNVLACNCLFPSKKQPDLARTRLVTLVTRLLPVPAPKAKPCRYQGSTGRRRDGSDKLNGRQPGASAAIGPSPSPPPGTRPRTRFTWLRRRSARGRLPSAPSLAR
jgi:hypothetical protein